MEVNIDLSQQKLELVQDLILTNQEIPQVLETIIILKYKKDLHTVSEQVKDQKWLKMTSLDPEIIIFPLLLQMYLNTLKQV